MKCPVIWKSSVVDLFNCRCCSPPSRKVCKCTRHLFTKISEHFGIFPLTGKQTFIPAFRTLLNHSSLLPKSVLNGAVFLFIKTNARFPLQPCVIWNKRVRYATLRYNTVDIEMRHKVFKTVPKQLGFVFLGRFQIIFRRFRYITYVIICFEFLTSQEILLLTGFDTKMG